MIYKAEDVRVTIPIGRVGERNIKTVEFDISDWIAKYGEGSVSLLIKRAKEDIVYPASISQDGQTVTWNITDTDTAVKGVGKGELVYTIGDKIKKGVVFSFTVSEALTGTSENPPEPYKTYVERVIEAVEEINSLSFTDSGNGNIVITYKEGING